MSHGYMVVAFWTGEYYFLGEVKNLDGVQGPKILNFQVNHSYDEALNMTNDIRLG
jgi:hypothetical protein